MGICQNFLFLRSATVVTVHLADAQLCELCAAVVRCTAKINEGTFSGYLKQFL